MNPENLQQQTLEPVNPLDLFQPEWKVSQRSVNVNSLIVRHDFQSPYKAYIPHSTHHFVSLQLSHGTRQVTRIADEEYVGSFTIGEFFLHPATRSGFYAWETTDEAISFIIEPNFLCRIAERTECLNPNKIELNPILRDRDPLIEHIARSFLGEMQAEALGGRIYSEALATQFAVHLLRNYNTFPIKLKQYNGGLSLRKIQAAIDYIQANLAETIRLNDLAKITKTSTYHFCRLFKKTTGMTPYQYVMQQRIELGKQLLKENSSIAEIALSCGFASQSSFTTAFRKYVGVTPKTYRQKI